MAISLGVGIILGIYVLIMFFAFWFCVIADVDNSPTARFVSETLPTKIMKLAGKVVGPSGVKVIEAIMERLLAIIYLTVVVGCFLVLWVYAYPKARESQHVANYHLTMGYLLFFLALFTWRITMTASPGVITKDTIQFYDHYPYDDLLYVKGRQDRKKGIPRLPRSKYDRLKHHQHVARFDHYCGWVAGTIGEENYRLFLLFVLTQFVMCVYGTVILGKFFMGEIKDKKLMEVTFFDRATGQEYQASKWIAFQYLFHKHIHEASVLAIMAVMSVALIFFLGYHFYITSKGMTTNEHYKWGEVRKWHKEQVRKYQEYKQKHGDAPAESPTHAKDNGDSSETKPPIPNVDVTCTGGKATDGSTDGSHREQQETFVMEDPGPMPTNIYNRGFIENWKEVLFPVSLRRRAAAAKGMDKAKAT